MSEVKQFIEALEEWLLDTEITDVTPSTDEQ